MTCWNFLLVLKERDFQFRPMSRTVTSGPHCGPLRLSPDGHPQGSLSFSRHRLQSCSLERTARWRK